MTQTELIEELARKGNVSPDQVEAILLALATTAYREAPSPDGFTVPGLCTFQVTSRPASSSDGTPIEGEKKKMLLVTPNERVMQAVFPNLHPGRFEGTGESRAASSSSPEAPEELITITCSHCSQELEVSQEAYPLKAQCPACSGDLVIPAKLKEGQNDSLISCSCDACGQSIAAMALMLGRTIKCPSCGESVVLTDREAADAPSDETGLESDVSSFGTTMRIHVPSDILEEGAPPLKESLTSIRVSRAKFRHRVTTESRKVG